MALRHSRKDQPLTIHLSQISKSFGRFPALKSVDLETRPGEFLALLGPSGSGKTTLLRVIAGLEIADSGSVAFEGEDVTAVKVADRGIGFVFQQYALFKHMSVADNIGFGLSVRKRRDRPSRARIRARAQELLDLVQLSGLGDRYPAQLSGGQRQRVALARALAVEPRLLLLDEPFGALDAKVRKELRHWLRAFHDRVGLTTIFVTHDQEEALEVADRIVVMRAGAIEQIGTPDGIYNDPANAFVYDFVGESNCLRVDVADGRVRHGTVAIGLDPRNATPGCYDLYFRPHQVRLVSSPDQGIAATILSTRQREGRLRAEVRVDGAVEPLEFDLAGEPSLEAGSPIAFAPTDYRLFAVHPPVPAG